MVGRAPWAQKSSWPRKYPKTATVSWPSINRRPGPKPVWRSSRKNRIVDPEAACLSIIPPLWNHSPKSPHWKARCSTFWRRNRRRKESSLRWFATAKAASRTLTRRSLSMTRGSLEPKANQNSTSRPSIRTRVFWVDLWSPPSPSRSWAARLSVACSPRWWVGRGSTTELARRRRMRMSMRCWGRR